MRLSTRLTLAGLLVALTVRPAVGQQRAPQVADVMVALIARYDQAWNARDTATVNRLLAPNYQYFTSTGGLSSRTVTLQFLSSPDYRLEYTHRSEVQVRVSGPVVVASSRWQGRGSYRGEAFTDDQRCGLVWLKAAAGWQLLSEHCTQIARAPTPSS